MDFVLEPGGNGMETSMIQARTLLIWAFSVTVFSQTAIAAGSGDHSHEEPADMIEEMIEDHAGHDHAHDFEILDEVSPEDVGRTVNLLVDLGLALPPVDGDRGRDVFMQKGCIVCHAINNVGIDIGPSLNAGDMPETMHAFEFAARMWRGAAAMAAMQEDLFGEMIDLTGQELADIVAFAHDQDAQDQVTPEMVPEKFRELLE
jgi:mono/diheme cytochrome c family protein